MIPTISYDRTTLVKMLEDSQKELINLKQSYLQDLNSFEQTSKKNEELKDQIKKLQEQFDKLKGVRKQNKKLSVLFQMKFSPKEKTNLIELAEQEQKTLSGFVRLLISNYQSNYKKPSFPQNKKGTLIVSDTEDKGVS